MNMLTIQNIVSDNSNSLFHMLNEFVKCKCTVSAHNIGQYTTINAMFVNKINAMFVDKRECTKINWVLPTNSLLFLYPAW